MRRRKKLIIAILLVILFGLVISIINALYFPSSTSALATGEKNILICAIDESEPREGMGACDMAFIVHMNDGKLTGYEAVYPGGLRHPTEAEPAEYVAQGAGAKLLLHDAFYSANNTQGMKWAAEIVSHNQNTSIDAVVCINSQAVDAILTNANPLTIDGQQVNASGIDIIREEQYENGNSRGDAVLKIIKAVSEKANDPNCKSAMIDAALEQYNQGNIIMYPEDAFVTLLASKGLNSLFK